MRERLAKLLPADRGQAAIHTFHSLGLAILREHAAAAGLNRGFRIASESDKAAIFADVRGFSPSKTDGLLRAVSKIKRTGTPVNEETAELHAAYQRALLLRNLIDFDDLVCLPVRMLEREPEVAAEIRERQRSISVDEFQDIDEQQYRLIRLLAPDGKDLCVIGDPNQAIYGFRGADASCFERFSADYPDAKIVRLQRNYRSSGTIVAASTQVLATANDNNSLAEVVREMHERIMVHTAPTDRAEAEFVVQTIEGLIGGHNFFSIDSGRSNGTGETLSFGDIAVLHRTGGQSAALVEAFDRSGIPYKRHAHALLADDPAVATLLSELFDVAGDDPLPVRLRAAAERVFTRDAAIDRAGVRTRRETIVDYRRDGECARGSASQTPSRSRARRTSSILARSGFRYLRCMPPRDWNSPSCSSSGWKMEFCRCTGAGRMRRASPKSGACSMWA